MRIILTHIIFFSVLLNLSAQELSDSTLNVDTTTRPTIPNNGTKTYNNNIKSIQTYVTGNILSYPVIGLQSPETITISFDELKAQSSNLLYKVTHCDKNWQKSNMIPIEYSKGLEYNQIKDWFPSQGTMVDYVHYRITLPNDEFSFTKSGNYVVEIFSDTNQSKPICETRIIVVEQKVTINAQVKQSSIVESMITSQEVNIDINYNSLPVRDPYQDLTVFILQNGRWDNAIKDFKPTFVNNTELSYPKDGSNVFLGGNEFRQFNTKTYKYLPDHIKSIKNNGLHYVYTLQNDQPRRFLDYNKTGDLNGKYAINNDVNKDVDISSDYVEVLFQLAYDDLEAMGNIYLFGALTNWEINDDAKMIYDNEKHAYTKSLLLKQGMYDYQYAYVDNLNKTIDCTYEENSHYETQNDYLIFVYFHDISTNYDGVVGYSLIKKQ